NLSRRNSTVISQSSNHVDNSFPARNAIDGDESTLSMTAPHHQQEAWLQVDLGFIARIQRVEALHRYDVTFYRTHGFYVFVSNASDFRQGTPCLFDTVHANPVTLSCSLRGRYVTFYTNVSSIAATYEAFAELVEFQVFGCEENRFGQNSCQEKCHCASGCNPDDGVCDVPGCTAGYKGPKCNQGCDNNSFGPDCNHTCHCSTPGCELVIGLCNKPGCEVGYFGPACDFTCKTTNFGENCKQECRCETPGCHHVTGICNIPGCEKGYSGQTCSNVVDVNDVFRELSGSNQQGVTYVFVLIVLGMCTAFVSIVILIVAVCVRKKKRKRVPRDGHSIAAATYPNRYNT
ncbi:multiple epidermal growth factor-like domains protein 11, partial [Ylistrum balloti]|uniref:multiple epidermal growth factor-like domains protein 11 n=1 Tax=Ylistrum balloti TaxID=509963 RepID=UPI002905EAB5